MNRSIRLYFVVAGALLSGASVSAENPGQTLQEMVRRDQEVRRALEEQALGSPEWKTLAETMSKVDHENIATLKEILDKHGWPSSDQSSRAAFLILQHAPVEDQKTYLPLVRNAVRSELLSRGGLALLEDRILMHEGKPQIYGSQLTRQEGGSLSLWPIGNEAEVDARRAEVGLEPLARYLARFGVVYERRSEPDGADKPATASDPKREGNEHPKLESEASPR